MRNDGHQTHVYPQPTNFGEVTLMTLSETKDRLWARPLITGSLRTRGRFSPRLWGWYEWEGACPEFPPCDTELC